MDDRLGPVPVHSSLTFVICCARSIDEARGRGVVCASPVPLGIAGEGRMLIVGGASGCLGSERLEEHAEHDGNG